MVSGPEKSGKGNKNWREEVRLYQNNHDIFRKEGHPQTLKELKEKIVKAKERYKKILEEIKGNRQRHLEDQAMLAKSTSIRKRRSKQYATGESRGEYTRK